MLKNEKLKTRAELLNEYNRDYIEWLLQKNVIDFTIAQLALKGISFTGNSVTVEDVKNKIVETGINFNEYVDYFRMKGYQDQSLSKKITDLSMDLNLLEVFQLHVHSIEELERKLRGYEVTEIKDEIPRLNKEIGEWMTNTHQTKDNTPGIH